MGLLTGVVLDSSILLEAERKRIEMIAMMISLEKRFGDVPVLISCVTLAELAHGLARSGDASVLNRRRHFLHAVLETIDVEPVTARIALRAGLIDGELGGRGLKLGFQDLLIGVTALERGYAVLTRNERHFQLVPDLTVVQL